MKIEDSINIVMAEAKRLQEEIEALRAELDAAKGKAEFYRTERNQNQRKAERLAEALRWYVDNDDTNDGQAGKEFWIAGRDRARALLREQEKGK